jgi:hypothetical protein
MDIFVYLGSCFVSAIFCGWYAKKNGDSIGEWVILGMAYPPFVSIPAVLFCARPAK